MKNSLMRNDTAKHMRAIHGLILKGNLPETKERDSFDIKPLVWIVMVLGGIIFWIGVFCFFSKAHAQDIPDQKAVKTIIGEAEDQGFEGMLAVAHALQNRGTLKGCYGYRSYRVRNHLYSRGILQEATLAWQQSAMDFDITHGAKYWENVNAFGLPYWAREMKITARIKDHVFFK